MGSFIGHLLPGSFFILFGIWHVVNTYTRFFKCKLASRRFYSSATFSCLHWSFPLEGTLKILVTTVAMIGEIRNGYNPEKCIVIPENSHHVTMYFGFAVSGIVDCLVFYRVLWLPEKSDYAMSALAFVCEGVLFAFHQHPGYHNGHVGDHLLETTVHKLLLYVVIASAFFIFGEMLASYNVLVTLFRGTLLIIQGTWFIHIAFILYPPWNNQIPRWDTTSIDSVIFNIFACFAITAVIGAVVRKCTVPKEFLIRASQRARNHIVSVGQANASNLPGLTNADSDSDSENENFAPARTIHPP